LACGAWIGVRTTRIPAPWNTSSIANQEAHRFRPVWKRPWNLAGSLGDPFLVRMRGATSEVHAPSSDLDKEQHVQLPEPERVNGQEIDGDHAFRLRLKELTPQWPGAPRRGAHLRRA
jgi:hypothetical protein